MQKVRDAGHSFVKMTNDLNHKVTGRRSLVAARQRGMAKVKR
jgi:hypothetical protein